MQAVSSQEVVIVPAHFIAMESGPPELRGLEGSTEESVADLHAKLVVTRRPNTRHPREVMGSEIYKSVHNLVQQLFKES